MNSNQSKKFNYFLSFLFLAGILFNGFIVFHVSQAYEKFDHKKYADDVVQAGKQECINALQSVGFSASESESELLISHTGLEYYGANLGQISLALTECPGYQVNYLCTGTGCEEDIALRLGIKAQ